MSRLRKLFGVFWKIGWALVHSLVGFVTIRLVFPRLSQAERFARSQAWSRQALKLLDIRLDVRGHPPVQGPMLLVANHISWLDIPVLHAARHCRFVSKSDVKRWPLIATLAEGSGTLFIERASRRDAMRVVHTMAERLVAGDIVAIFPEGTTSDGVSMLPFHANLIQAAISTDMPVQPVALQFIETATGRMSLAPCYIGDDTLLGSIWRTLTAPRLTAVVTYGLPQRAEGRNRRMWADDLHAAVGLLRELPKIQQHE